MDTQRLILWLIFSFSAVMLWQAWERDHAPPVVPNAPMSQPAPQVSGAPPAATPVPAPNPAGASTAGAPPAAARPVTGQTIEVRTDLYVADIDTVGGTIDRVALDKHRDAQDPSKP